MKIKILDQNVKAHLHPDSSSEIIKFISAGTVVELKEQDKKDVADWKKIELQSGAIGYIPGDVNVFANGTAIIEEENIVMWQAASNASAQMRTLNKGTRIQLADAVIAGGETWILIECSDGGSGYISSKTKLKIIQSRERPPKRAGVSGMIIGGIFFILGIAVTIVSYIMASSSARGGTYVVAWGAVLYGAIKFFRGLNQFASGD